MIMWFKKTEPDSNKNAALLAADDVLLNATARDKWEAIRLVGNRLLAAGRVTPEYLDAMEQREAEFSTYIGNGLAIPHGVGGSQRYIKKSGLSVAQFPAGVDFGGGNVAYLVVAIAGLGDEHLDLLSTIALRCEDLQEVMRLARVTSAEEILRAFA